MVDFALTDENRLVQQSARAFAETEILPNIRRWDEEGGFPRELFGQGWVGCAHGRDGPARDPDPERCDRCA